MDSLEQTLSIEQQFSHRLFADCVRELSLEQARDLAIELHKQMMYKDNLYKEIILSQERDVVDALFGAN
jgi:hypothetical protein